MTSARMLDHTPCLCFNAARWSANSTTIDCLRRSLLHCDTLLRRTCSCSRLLGIGLLSVTDGLPRPVHKRAPRFGGAVASIGRRVGRWLHTDAGLSVLDLGTAERLLLRWQVRTVCEKRILFAHTL